MKTIFITGAAGYVGHMLVEKFAARGDVQKIIALDKEPRPEGIQDGGKTVWITTNTSETDVWLAEVQKYAPSIVIHAAWQIRDMYGKRALQWKWNVEGSDAIFDFAFSHPSTQRLVYFSTVASYGAYPDNMIEHKFKESESFRESNYNYAEEKRIVEEHLKEKYTASDKRVSVAIIRPAAITGPRGRFSRIRFGLQSALAGQLAGSFVYSLVAFLTSFVPATPKWARQFVHEDDVVDATELLAFSERVMGYEAYNLCPPGSPVLAKDMAEVVKKRILRVPPLLIRFVFFLMWNGTLGKIPTARGAWKGYSYPIMVNGEKISNALGFRYTMSSKDAFQYTDGRYEYVVPESSRRHKV